MTGRLTAFSSDSAPEDLEKKTTLLLYFAKYMDEHLIQVNILLLSVEDHMHYKGTKVLLDNIGYNLSQIPNIF